MGDKSSTETTSVDIPEPTPEELALIDNQLALAEGQIDRIKRFDDFNAQLFEQYTPQLQRLDALRNQRASLDASQLGLGQQVSGQQRQLFDAGLDNALSVGGLTPEQDALIAEATNQAIQSSLSDIGGFRDEGLTSLREELAPSLGLRPSDTPVVDRGQEVLKDSNRLASQVVGNLRSQAAGQRLQFPLQVAQTRGGLIQGQQQIGGATTQYQQQLADQAFNNRLRLTSVTGNSLLGLGSLGASPNTLPALTNARTAASTVTRETEGGGNLFGDIASLAGGIGGLATGIGAFTNPAGLALGAASTVNSGIG